MNPISRFFEFFYAAPKYYMDSMRELCPDRKVIDMLKETLPAEAESIERTVSLEKERMTIPYHTLMGAFTGSAAQAAALAVGYHLLGRKFDETGIALVAALSIIPIATNIIFGIRERRKPEKSIDSKI